MYIYIYIDVDIDILQKTIYNQAACPPDFYWISTNFHQISVACRVR